MIFLYFIIIFFLTLFFLGMVLNILIYRLIRKNNFVIERSSSRIGFTVKELTQLYTQSNSIETSNRITAIIKLTKVSHLLFWVYASLFILIWILTLIK